MTVLGGPGLTVHLPGHNPTNTLEAREQYIQSLRRQAKISPELETAIREDLPITAAKRQEIENAKYQALADQDWLMRHKRRGQKEVSEFIEWNSWLARRVEG